MQKQKKIPSTFVFFEPSNSVEDDLIGREEHNFSQNDSFSNFKVFGSEKVPSGKLWQRENTFWKFNSEQSCQRF